MNKLILYTPFTGLGLYGGFRGNRWLRNRIKIFKQFVIPSLLNQTDQEFVHWIQWRPEERNNPYVKELERWLYNIPGYKFVFTYHGLCFWDDKYEDDIARERLATSLRKTLPELLDWLPDCEEVTMLLVPSDDLYQKQVIQGIRNFFNDHGHFQVVGFEAGYICNYHTKQVLEYNPNTNPPFFAIRFPRKTFFDSGLHMNYTGPYKSHEYVGDNLKLGYFKERGFMVGTHGENVSTHFNHPFGGRRIMDQEWAKLCDEFGILHVPNLVLPRSWRKKLLQKLPHRIRRKLRYWEHQKIGSWLYNFLRN